MVQYVLSLKDENSTRIICICLESQYTHLAEKKGGSHIVEKCIRSSEFGMRSVVGALLKSEKALFRLASHQFGNYVVQTALKVTKVNNLFINPSHKFPHNQVFNKFLHVCSTIMWSFTGVLS